MSQENLQQLLTLISESSLAGMDTSEILDALTVGDNIYTLGTDRENTDEYMVCTFNIKQKDFGGAPDFTSSSLLYCSAYILAQKELYSLFDEENPAPDNHNKKPRKIMMHCRRYNVTDQNKNSVLGVPLSTVYEEIKPKDLLGSDYGKINSLEKGESHTLKSTGITIQRVV